MTLFGRMSRAQRYACSRDAYHQGVLVDALSTESVSAFRAAYNLACERYYVAWLKADFLVVSADRQKKAQAIMRRAKVVRDSSVIQAYHSLLIVNQVNAVGVLSEILTRP